MKQVLKPEGMLGELLFPDHCSILPQTEATPALDIQAELVESLDNPVEFPALSRSIVPGDRIAIAVSRQVPQLASIIQPLIDYLIGKQIEPDSICVVLPTTTDPPEPDLGVRWVSHADKDPERLAYLGIDDFGEPIYVSRELFDADMVIPVLRQDLVEGEQANGIVPEFCFRQRFDENGVARPDRGREQFDADLVNDRLGVFFSIEVVVGPGNQLHHILAGSRAAVRAESEARLQEVWDVPVEGDPDLIVVTVEGDQTEQSWRSLSQAIESADQISADSPIIVLSELTDPPDRDLKKRMRDELVGEVRLAKAPSPFDHLAEIVGRRPVHLQSRLSEEIVEDLGIGWVTNAAQIQRLVDASANCLVLRDAHRCRIQVTGRT